MRGVARIGGRLEGSNPGAADNAARRGRAGAQGTVEAAAEGTLVEAGTLEPPKRGLGLAVPGQGVMEERLGVRQAFAPARRSPSVASQHYSACQRRATGQSATRPAQVSVRTMVRAKFIHMKMLINRHTPPPAPPAKDTRRRGLENIGARGPLAGDKNVTVQ